MENILIMNKIPLPRYYDGVNWNTVFKPTRKSIPKYLHEDLPELKLLEIKERFKQIGKFNCPRLEYFDNFIRKRNTGMTKKSNTARSSQKKQYQKLQQQLQYALLLCDKQSPVLDNLVNKAKDIKYSRKQKGESKRYFDGTINLVFRNRKNQYLSQEKKKEEDYQVNSSVNQKIQNLRLESFN